MLDLPHDAAVLAIGEVGVRVVLELKLHQLVDLHLLDHVFGELLFVDVDAGVAEAHRVARDFEVGKDPFVGCFVEDYLVIDHFDVLGRDEVIDDEVFELELFLEDSSPFLELFDLSSVLLLKLTIFALQVL